MGLVERYTHQVEMAQRFQFSLREASVRGRQAQKNGGCDCGAKHSSWPRPRTASDRPGLAPVLVHHWWARSGGEWEWYE